MAALAAASASALAYGVDAQTFRSTQKEDSIWHYFSYRLVQFEILCSDYF